MRVEKDFIEQILNFANAAPDIRAVIRTDLVPVRKYLYQYNFYFIVDDTDKYNSDIVFSTCFGERILLYRGDKNYPEMFKDTKAHLMVFNDGITMAVYVVTRDAFVRGIRGENVWIGKSYQKLLDKDGMLTDIEKNEDEQLIFMEKPTKEAFEGTCAEFFWVIKTFSEYVLRDELPAAMFYLNISVRDMLNRMIRWYICMENDFSVELGILDSYFKKYLSADLFDLYKKTYPCADSASIWDAYNAVVSLFRIVAMRVADRFDYAYPSEVEKNITEFISKLRTLE